MSRLLTAQQELLVGRRSLATVPIVVITGYSQRGTPATASQEDRRRSPWVVVKQWAFSDTAFQIGNLDVQPYLVSMTPYVQSINATPEVADVGSGLLRNFDLTLRNGVVDGGLRLIEELRANNIEQADILVGQLSIDRIAGVSEVDTLAGENLGELAAFYRGSVQQVGTVTNDAISLFCNSHTPFGALANLTVTNDTPNAFIGDDIAVSATAPTIYGNAIRRVPGTIWSTGFSTTLRTSIGRNDVQAVLSEIPPNITESSGTMFIGGEKIDYNGISLVTVTGLIRVVELRTAHFSGEVVSFIPDEVTFVTAENALAAGVSDSDLEFFLRNPLNGGLLNLDAGSGGVSTSAPPAGIGYTAFPSAEWQTISEKMASNARITAQAQVGPSTLEDKNTVLDDSVAVESTGSGTATGDWNFPTGNTGSPTWFFDGTGTNLLFTRTITLDDLNNGSLDPNAFFTEWKILWDLFTGAANDPATKVTIELSCDSAFGKSAFTATEITEPDLIVPGEDILLQSPTVFSDGQTTIEDAFVGFELRLQVSSLVGPTTGDFWSLNWGTLFLKVEQITSFTDETVIDAEIASVAGATGIEAYFDSRQLYASPSVFGYNVPGVSLHREFDVNANDSGTFESQVTAWASYMTFTSNVSSGDSVIEFRIPSGTLDMSDGSPAVSPEQPGWLGRILENGGSATLEMLVTNSVVTFPTIPAERRVFTQASPAAGTYEEGFSSFVDTGSPSLNDIRTVRITIKGQSAGGSKLLIWWVGPTRSLEAVLNGTVPDDIVHPTDHLRSFLTDDCNLPTTVIDESSLAFLHTNLGTTKEAQVLSADYGIGADHVAFLLAFGRDHRFQMVSTEIDSNSIYRWFATDTSYLWGAATKEITQFVEVSEVGVDGATIFTKRTFSFDPDRSNVSGRISETWRGAILVSADQNDISSTITTSDITDQEDIVGERIGPDMFLPSVVDDASAEDIAGYYFTEDLNGARIFQITGVPWIEGYDIELSDIVNLTVPWYGSTVKLRIIETRKNWRTELVDMIGVEVS